MSPATDRYTHGHESAILGAHSTRTALNSAAHLLPHLKPGMHLLDVGFGPGTITLDFAEITAPGRVVGIENTQAPFAVAEANAASRHVTNLDLVLADVMSLPFPDDSFDLVHAHQVLQHLTNPVGALEEMARVCRPGGLIATRDADYAGMFWYPESSGLTRWQELYRAIAKGNHAEPDAARHLRSWAEAAALRDVRITASTWCYATEDECAWWAQSQADRAEGEAFTAQAAALGVPASEVSQIAEAWRAWGREPGAMFVIPHAELLASPAR